MSSRNDPETGTEDLERGMQAGRAVHVSVIALIAGSMLLAANSGGLAKWTQTLPSTPVNIWLAERAGDWHALMLRLGPAAIYERLKSRQE